MAPPVSGIQTHVNIGETEHAVRGARAGPLKSLSIRSKLVVLFSALVAVPLVVAIAWLGLTAHLSVLDAGRALTGVADDSMSQSAHDVARLTAENAKRSSAELVVIGQRSLKGFAKREIQASEQ